MSRHHDRDRSGPQCGQLLLRFCFCREKWLRFVHLHHKAHGVAVHIQRADQSCFNQINAGWGGDSLQAGQNIFSGERHSHAFNLTGDGVFQIKTVDRQNHLGLKMFA